ncbi:hypothetical protein ALTERO38_60872 [Alteromonas sp. 38]|nr:hypothetical protein ALTERO38_60872 [Alteromonas sp. 38]
MSDSDYNDKLLQINENGEHRFFEAYIGSAFRHGWRLPFVFISLHRYRLQSNRIDYR